MSITTMDVWKKFCQSLANLVAGSDFDSSTQAISFAGVTLAVDLGNADPAISNENIFQCGNMLPAWSPCYSPLGGLLSSYTAFLDNVNLGGDPDPNLQSEINVAAAAMNASQTNYNTVAGQARTAFQQARTINPNLDFNTFVQSQYPVYIQAENDLMAKTSAWASLMIQAYGAGYALLATARDKCASVGGAAAIDMQNAYNMAVETGSTAPAGSGRRCCPARPRPRGLRRCFRATHPPTTSTASPPSTRSGRRKA